MARLNHPKLVTVHEVATANGRDYVAMELIEGETLAEWLRAQQRPEAEIVDAFVQAGRATPGATSSLIEEQRKRPPEPLEAYPLESIQMLGTITQKKETHALVKAGPHLYRVRKGNYMGQNFGVITEIDEAQISLKELVQDSTGDWVERMSSLQLVEAKR